MLGWRPAEVTVVAKRFIQENAGEFNEYIVDVRPADGGLAFRTTLKNMAFALGEPDVGDVVPAFCRAGKQAVKFDWAKLQSEAMAKRNATPDGWDAALRETPGTAVRSAGQVMAGTARRGSAAQLMASGQRMTAVLREFSPAGKTVGDLDPALPDPNDPVYRFKVELPLDSSSLIEAIFLNRVPAAKVASLRLGAQLSVAVNPANPGHEVAIDWASSPQ